jgi:uncharacterized protein YbbC (DUF1343 family)
MTVTLGSEVLFGDRLLEGRTIGLVANPASVNARFQHVADMAEGRGVRIGALFGPQHGFRGEQQENMIETAHADDRRRRIPVYSLYSDTRQPDAAMFEGLDALVIDLQDVGTRIYTYIYTMANCLVAAAREGLPVVICDRPNPIGGATVEGPMLEDGFRSFVGQYPIPMRHGLTIGELARFFNDHHGIGAKLEVVAMRNWQREDYFDLTGLPWVPPSPNLPTLDSAVVYPGTVLLEGTNASEGRGTARPFELVGAPWVDAEAFAADLNSRHLAGVHFRPARFEPAFHKHAGVSCGGCQLHVTDRQAFQPVATGVALVEALRDAGPTNFAWRAPPYEYEPTRPPIDILFGSSGLRETLDAGQPTADLAATWPETLEAFSRLVEPFRLYPSGRVTSA